MTEKIRVLLVDDDETFRRVLEKELALMGYQMATAARAEQALAMMRELDFDALLLDIKMPGMDGVEALKHIKASRQTTQVVILTGHGTIENAIECMKLGAYDYVTKPCALEELSAVIQKAAEKRAIIRQNILLRQELSRLDAFSDFVGNSAAMVHVFELIAKVADTDSTVLVQGESGVGKELVARAIHRNSARRENPFVVVDCASLQENLLESELFGHERGAYTGAIALKHGLFEVAHTGTLFMDEIGEIPPSIQVKLLRVLENHTFRRVGSTKDITVDVRVIGATNKDLRRMMLEGDFREDLFYRLNVVSISIPPLRERKEDIPLLAEHFVRNSRVTGKENKAITREAMDLLLGYHWPGNIRELQNVIERALILSEDDYIRPADLPLNLKGDIDFMGRTELPDILTLENLEKEYISRVLKKFNGHRVRTAKALQISERTLYRKIKRYNIQL